MQSPTPGSAERHRQRARALRAKAALLRAKAAAIEAKADTETERANRTERAREVAAMFGVALP